ncbi:oxysterol-binding protein-related protein 9 isoform X2 [Diorhabda carinulata]|uniref:oxysterol-binding protein-related protein 9-like isoform X2 n=1 Tax=Diorhabda sublineata TaxID=1163346 RepID=UPI0024E18A7A|nr:oxysterol-binding protein-related protein 9-like isoform X2 [Diorhabda sublineata]XP_057670634.1 oxysterol-binding protein-related protein 9 isoform X2 [Diorhabda carinulata]
MEGSLSKWTNVMKGWQYRWFVLDDNSGLLSYYTSKEKMMRGVRRGCVRLKGAVIGIDDEDDSTFTVTVDHKTFHFQARDAEERQKWVQALEETIIRHGNRMRYETHHPSPTIRDFDNKVSEADAYLQLMIDQTRKLEDRIAIITDSDEKVKCQVILDHANIMLDNIKHSIVLLQIAKNTAHPVNGIYHQRPSTSNSNVAATGNETIAGEAVVQSGIELGSECVENARRHSRTINNATSLMVPDMSYSSSEGEDDFYDANDSPFSSGSQLPSPSIRSFDNDTQIPVPVNKSSIDSIANNIRQDSIRSRSTNFEDLDYDALYEENDENSLELESHGSVIRHLLSQVKIGMDLTKVVLPTFILERRSLLEMYADYFAHPDMFLNIPNIKDPRDRMVQVVRWYLSSYHAGRKSTVAKKPYNPILGEVFRCHWDVPNVDNGSDDSLVDDGPIPWCKKSQLTFVAEQVSHHPPISAFYAEHYNKRISFNAHVYTKSKFLGLSICVYNIGQGIVNVIDYDEEYILTFPNGYGRSILTVPWVELGGTVTISCPKTGYNCNIEFITKPFYGNKKNKITADIYGPDEKKPFLTVSGEWSGVMDYKWTDRETEEHVDVNQLSIIKKLVRPINMQEDNESRKLWKEVTAGLKFNEIDRATAAKQSLEQKQRDEARERKESGQEWQTRLFYKSGEESYTYIKPLKQRISSGQSTNT